MQIMSLGHEVLAEFRGWRAYSQPRGDSSQKTTRGPHTGEETEA